MKKKMRQEDYEKWSYYIKMIREHRRLLWRYGRKKFVQLLYQQRWKQKVDLDHPVGFNEKLNARKLSKNPLFVLGADKVKVRNYVEEKIGRKHLIPQYFCKKKVTVEDLQKLPNQFILKTSNGSGTNIIVRNKKQEDLQQICDTINFFTKIKYGYIWGEFYYNKVPIRIVAEKLLEDENGDIPNDLKIHCFNNGREKHKIIESYYKIEGQIYKNCYDENWKPLNYVYGFTSDGRKIPRPKNLKEIIKIADKLSEDTNYVRVDLYNIKNKLYFGELTFIPGAGYAHFSSKDADLLWGEYMGNEK